MDIEVLQTLQEEFPHQHTLFEELALLESEKLWHEITQKLGELVHDAEVVSRPKALLRLYQNFVKKFANKLDQLLLANFLTFAANGFDTNQEKDAFLEENKHNLKEEGAQDIVELQQISYKLDDEHHEANDTALTALKAKIEKQSEALIYSFLYRVSYEFALQSSNQELIYLNALQYLAYTQQEDIPKDQQLEISVNMAIAILLSPKIYNFSELLQQPVVKSLENSPFSWLHVLISTFNRGDVDKFYVDIETFQTQIVKNSQLSQNIKLIEEKIRIMAFLELVFNLPKNDRTISFSKIAQKTKQTEGQVEYLLMRSMSLELVKGSIDQVKKTVTISWIIPRILDTDRVEVMKQKFDEWTNGLKKLINLVEQQPVSLY